MRALKVRIDELAKRFVDTMMESGDQCDFVQEVAVNYPLYVIMSMLGLPEEDFPRMLEYTQELFGNDDAEFQRGTSKEEQLGALLEMFEYFTVVTRRGEKSRPKIWRRPSPTPRSTVSHYPISRRCRTTRSLRPPATTPRAR